MDVGDPAREAVRLNPVWYHTIELGPGVVTPGMIDLRRLAPRVLPTDLTGKRALDVGTFDGFWAFELERRGAAVTAIDIERLEAGEWPPSSRAEIERRLAGRDIELGRGFRIAAQALDSKVDRRTCSVYELTAETIDGEVDFACIGALLLHLRDPVRALERVRSVLAEGGELRVFEPVSLLLTLLSPRRPVASFQAAGSDFNWWLPNVAALAAYARAAGFQQVERIALLRAAGQRQLRQRYACMRCAG